jgi:hypothetical protein
MPKATIEKAVAGYEGINSAAFSAGFWQSRFSVSPSLGLRPNDSEIKDVD